ncbi:MAG: leucine-rich repeat domain-containing protein [Ruminococcaceae bacterium]|nr:leucine-rich repeat domain-containing protein [Oscillospiraceae bacterium]
MKKKILVFLSLMALFVCLFAVSVSAADIPEWTEITEVDGMTNKPTFGTDGTTGATSRVLMSDGVTYPAYYICEDSESLGISFDDINTKAGKQYEAKNVVRIELPKGITTVTNALRTSNGYSALMTVVIPEGVNAINAYAFKANTALVCDIVIPEGCTDIGVHAFNGSGVTSVTLPSTLETLGKEIFMDCSALTSVYSKSHIIGFRMFYHCDELTTIKLENIVEIGGAAFNNSKLSKVSSLELPEGLTTIGEYAFPRMSITSLVIPSAVTTIDRYAFQDCESLEKVVVLGPTIGTNMFYGCSSLRTLVLTEKLEEFGDSALASVPQDSFTTYYTGTDYDRIKTLCSNSTRLSQASAYTYADYISGNYTSKKFMLIYDCNICTVGFDGKHIMSGNTKERFSSYLENITFIDTCTRVGCGNETVIKTIQPLFTCLGYSASQSGVSGIVLGFTVNIEAITEYESLTGKTISYGVFAVSGKKIGNNEIFANDGTAADGVINAEIKNNFSYFDLKIAGFADTQKDIKLALGGYVVTTDGEATEYSYLQSGTPNVGEKYSFVSYNDIITK